MAKLAIPAADSEKPSFADFTDTFCSTVSLRDTLDEIRERTSAGQHEALGSAASEPDIIRINYHRIWRAPAPACVGTIKIHVRPRRPFLVLPPLPPLLSSSHGHHQQFHLPEPRPHFDLSFSYPSFILLVSVKCDPRHACSIVFHAHPSETRNSVHRTSDCCPLLLNCPSFSQLPVVPRAAPYSSSYCDYHHFITNRLWLALTCAEQRALPLYVPSFRPPTRPSPCLSEGISPRVASFSLLGQSQMRHMLMASVQ